MGFLIFRKDAFVLPEILRISNWIFSEKSIEFHSKRVIWMIVILSEITCDKLLDILSENDTRNDVQMTHK